MKLMKRDCVFLVVATLLLWTASATAQRRKGSGRRSTSAVVLPTGTTLDVRLVSQIHSGEANNGDRFDGTLAQPVTVQGRTVMAKDARVTGRVIEAVSSGRLKRPASLTLELVAAGGVAVQTNPITLDGKSHAGRNAALIGGGAAAGAIIGAIAGGGKGAAIGAATGAGAGVGVAYLTGKQELVLPPEMLLQFSVTGGSSGNVAAAGSDLRPERRGDARSGPYEDPQVFSANSRRIIGDYLRVNRANLPPGLARRERLPPGLERQLQRNGTLPPGLQKRVEPFPADLDRRLPVLPAGMSRVFLGGRALLLDSSRRILDMFAVND